MEVTEPISPKKIVDLFYQSERIKVPSYQRRYSWKQENFEDLWNDLDALNEKENHFFGTIVFKSGVHKAQQVNEIDVVDGQQRITTISILLCSVRDYLKENFENDRIEERAKTINESLYLVDRDGKKRGLRLVLGNLDNKSYENIVEYPDDEIENENISNCYDFFYNKIDAELDGLTEIKQLHDKILDQLIYVSITAEEHSDSYQLFEAMNNRGLSLSPIDLMKNYLLMKADNDSNTDEEKVEELWGDIIMNIDRMSTNNPGVTFFRQYFMSSEIHNINEKVNQSKLYQPKFTDIVEQTNDIESMLVEIKKQSDLYRKLINQEMDEFSNSENSELNRLLRDAKIISITPFTLFLRTFSELNDVSEIKRVIEKTNALLIRRQICDRNTGPHDTIFNHLSQNMFNSNKDPLEYMIDYIRDDERFPSDDQFARYFSIEDFSRSDLTKYILSKIEEDYYGHGGKEVVESRYQVHIEHILPERSGKSLTNLWLNEFDISNEEHRNYKKKIGNLTLLESSPNIRASNRTLKKKQEYYTDNKTDFEMTHELVDLDKWDVDEIEKRSKKLSQKAVDVWSL